MDLPVSSASGSCRNGGERITFICIISAVAGLTLAGTGCFQNLIVYLIQEFNVQAITATQVSNVVSGCSSLFPVVGAVIADSFLGCFAVIMIFSCISSLGIAFLALTAMMDSLSPKRCGLSCGTPKAIQFAVLYTGIALAAIGLGGTRFTLATVGASQFDKPKERTTFFNWYFFTLYSAAVVGSTALVYMEDTVSWGLGLGLCVIANLVGLAVFVVGRRFYRRVEVRGSPFADVARVVVAAIRKRKAVVSSKTEDYYYGEKSAEEQPAVLPGNSLRFFNRAAIKTEGDIINFNGSNAEPKPNAWRLCTVQQVEDLKVLLRLFPLWSSSILLGTPIAIQGSLSVLQVLAMDRHLGPNFEIPAGSIQVMVLISTSLSLPLIDRLLMPAWHKLLGATPTPFQRIGMGHVLSIAGLAVSALVETKRLQVARSSHHHHYGSSLGALWLLPQLAFVGLGEAFHFPGQVTLYFQEFPTSLKSTSTAIISLILAVSFYLGTAVIDIITKSTKWLPDDINRGRIDKVYWILVTVGGLNFGYYLLCSKSYRYRNVEEDKEEREEGFGVQRMEL